MRRGWKILIAAVSVVMASVVLVSAITSTWFRQKLTVPDETSMILLNGAGTDELPAGIDLSPTQNPVDGWSWTGTQFVLSVRVQNTGTLDIYVYFHWDYADLPVGWTLEVSPANGTQVVVADTQEYVLSSEPPSMTAGTTTEDFDITVDCAHV